MTLTLTQAIELLSGHLLAHGDVPFVLWDNDTGYYFTLTAANLEAQRMPDGTVRVSLGLTSYGDPQEPPPAKRPLTTPSPPGSSA